MHYLHYQLDLGKYDIVQVTLSMQAFLRMMTEKNYEHYRFGDEYKFHGGVATTSPANLQPPSAGHWHLVIDLGGKEGDLKATVNILKDRAPKPKKGK